MDEGKCSQGIVKLDCWKGLTHMGLDIAEVRDAALLVIIQHLLMKKFSGAVKLGDTSLRRTEINFPGTLHRKTLDHDAR